MISNYTSCLPVVVMMMMMVLVFDLGNCNTQQFQVEKSIRSKSAMIQLEESEESVVLRRGSRSVHRSRRSVLNETEQTEALAAHNMVRRLEGASNMELMVWDTSLATIADTSALTCIWNHSNYGQNLYSTDSQLSINLTAAVMAWYNEKPYYNTYYITGQCLPHDQPCLHYSQVVWATSRRLGCAYTRCPTLFLSNLTNALLLVCNYDPPGNVIGQKPYQTGSGCSNCASGSWWCHEGLCDGSCSATARTTCGCAPVCLNSGAVTVANCSCSCAPGWDGSDCGVVCADQDPQCNPQPGQTGYPPSYCTRSDYGPTVRGLCRKMCNLCQGARNNQSTTTKPSLLSLLAVWLSWLLISSFRGI